MIALSAKIDLISDSKLILSSQSGFVGNNISSSVDNVIGTKAKSNNPFIIGSSKLGDGSTFSNGVGYFISNELSDEYGKFPTKYVLQINSSKPITSLTISFDTYNNLHPQSLNIDGTEYTDNDAIFTVSNLSPSNLHAVVISNWNKPNSPLVISGIYVGVKIEINRRNMTNLSRSISDRENLQTVSYGIISNKANIEFNDFSGEIPDYAEQNLLKDGLATTIYIENTLTKKKQEIGHFITREWQYDNDSKYCSVSLSDELIKWQEINVDSIDYYNEANAEPKNAHWFYDKLHYITISNGFKMLSFDELDFPTKSILDYMIIKYPTLKSGTLWSQWQKLCELCHLHIYLNQNGIVGCYYNEGN